MRAGVVVGADCWRMHYVTFGVVECFISIGIGCGLLVVSGRVVVSGAQ